MKIDIWWPIIPVDGDFDLLRFLQTKQSPLSGTEGAMLRLASALALNGIEVTLWNRITEGPSGIDRLHLRIPVNGKGTDILKADCSGDFLLFTWRADQDSENVATYQTKDRPRRILWLQNWEKRLIQHLGDDRISALVAVSRIHLDQYRFAIKRDRCTYIHNGIDNSYWTNPTGKNRIPGRVVFAGAPIETKGLHILLQAWPRIVEKVRDASLVVAGSLKVHNRMPGGRAIGISTLEFEERYIRPLLDWENQANPMHRVKWRGALPPQELRNEYQLAEICVINPNVVGSTECCSTTSLEAAACGCAIVGGCSGGLPETVRDGVTGLLVSSGRPEDVADAVVGLLRDKETCRRLGDNGVQWVHQFDMGDIAKKWISLFSTLSEHGRPNAVDWTPRSFTDLITEILRPTGIPEAAYRQYKIVFKSRR